MHDNNVNISIQSGIEHARQLFFTQNNLSNNEVLCINNDAIFVIGSRPINTSFGVFEFKAKNIYNTYIKTSSKLKIFYSFDQINQCEVIDIKGIKDDNLKMHKGYFLDEICNILYNINFNTIEYTIKEFNIFYKKFIEKELSIEYYRKFYGRCDYDVILSKCIYTMDYPSEELKNNVDISINLQLLRDIYTILIDIFRKKQK